VTRRRVVVEESVSLSLGKYLDEPVALAEVMNAIDALADDPRPAGSVPWGPTISSFMSGYTGCFTRSARRRSAYAESTVVVSRSSFGQTPRPPAASL
jgi:hypothetical protein